MPDLFNPPKDIGKLDHDALQNKFANHKRSRSSRPKVWQEIAISGSYGSQGRLDVLELQLAGSGGRTTESHCVKVINGYEIKASRSDLLADLRKSKWRRYLHCDAAQTKPGYLHRLYFVMPEGIAEPDEVPAECGVIFLKEDLDIFRQVRKAPTLEHKAVDENFFVRLLWGELGYFDRELEWWEGRRNHIEHLVKIMDRDRGVLKGHYKDKSLAKVAEDRERKLRSAISKKLGWVEGAAFIREALGE